MAKGEIYRVGMMSPRTARFLRKQGLNPEAASILVRDSRILRLTRDAKVSRGQALPPEMIKKMPEILNRPNAVLWDKRNRNLTYAFDIPGDPKKGKFIVRINFTQFERTTGKREAVTGNFVQSGGKVQRSDLADINAYELIEGAL